MATFSELIRKYGDSITLKSNSGSFKASSFSKELSTAINNTLRSDIVIQLPSGIQLTAKYIGDFNFSIEDRITKAILDGRRLNANGVMTFQHITKFFEASNQNFYKDLQEKAKYQINIPSTDVLTNTLITGTFNLKNELENNGTLEQTEDANKNNTGKIYGVKFNFKQLEKVFKSFILSMYVDVRGIVKSMGETETEILVYANGDLPENPDDRALAIKAMKDNLEALKSSEVIYTYALQEEQKQATLKTTLWKSAEFKANCKIISVK